MDSGELGRVYRDGEMIVRQGEVGNCMYVIQSGKAEVLRELEGNNVRLAVLGENDFFGEMAIFEHEVRSATVRALGEARILTVDKRTFLRRVQEDPTLAFNILRVLCERIRHQNVELSELRDRFDNLESKGAASQSAVEQRGPACGSETGTKEN